MNKIEIIWRNKRGHLAQEMSSGLEFSLVSEDNHQCSDFVLCKDFLHDAIKGCVNKQAVSIFGFSFDPKIDHAPCLRRIKLLLANSSDGKMRQKIQNCLDFIHQIEERMGMNVRTTCQECDDPPKKYLRGGVWLVTGSRRWVHSPVMVSLYTLFLRVGFVHTAGKPFTETITGVIDGSISPYSQVDQERLQMAKKGIDRIFKEGDRKIFCRQIKKNYPKKLTDGVVHDTLGIVGFAQGHAKIPDWYKEGKKK